MIEKLRRFGTRLGQTARLMVGVPDYDRYLEHLRQHHPERTPMSYEAFFRNRQAARYGSGQGKCC